MVHPWVQFDWTNWFKIEGDHTGDGGEIDWDNIDHEEEEWDT